MVRVTHKLVFIFTIFTHTNNLTNASSVTYSRGDKNAYLTARGQDSDLPSRPIHHPPKHAFDDPQKCTLYLAESSIPDAGLGLYTSIPLPKHSPVGHSEIGIAIHDLFHHHPDAQVSTDLYKNYVWGSNHISYGAFEATKSSVMIPGIGMMTNDHPGLINVHQIPTSSGSRFWMDEDDALATEGNKHDTLTDMGRGSSSPHSNLRFRATKHMNAGDELYISYGQGWFVSRENDNVPSAENYKMAYDTVKTFMQKAKEDGLDVYSLGMQQRYEERIYKADWLKDRPRLKAALPERVADIPAFLKMGAVQFSMKDRKKSLEWIEENGMCMDGIVAGTSTIPQAGRGAFAAKGINEGGVVITTPVITMNLNQIKLREEVIGSDWNNYVRHGGFQQILNYCYGHEDSTLVFFPAAPTVNFINHGSKEEANAEIRWSSSPHHQADWLDEPFSEMKTKSKSGLFFDIVATKDIQRGDEILLYYGKGWEDSWHYQIQNWDGGNFTDMLGVATSADYNLKEKDSVVRSVFEQKTNPYPNHLMTTCFFAEPPESSCVAPTDTSLGVKCIVQSNFSSTSISGLLRPCEILSRHEGDNGSHWYTANVTVTGAGNKDKQKDMPKKRAKASKSPPQITEYYLVEYLPRYAIRFADKPYTKDQYRKGAFRHPIEMGEGMMAEGWMDLRRAKEG
jgi:hypothetical protein